MNASEAAAARRARRREHEDMLLARANEKFRAEMVTIAVHFLGETHLPRGCPMCCAASGTTYLEGAGA